MLFVSQFPKIALPGWGKSWTSVAELCVLCTVFSDYYAVWVRLVCTAHPSSLLCTFSLVLFLFLFFIFRFISRNCALCALSQKQIHVCSPSRAVSSMLSIHTENCYFLRFVSLQPTAYHEDVVKEKNDKEATATATARCWVEGKEGKKDSPNGSLLGAESVRVRVRVSCSFSFRCVPLCTRLPLHQRWPLQLKNEVRAGVSLLRLSCLTFSFSFSNCPQ